MSKDNQHNEQFVLSYELLALMRWISEHESKALKRIITRSLSQGRTTEMNSESESLSACQAEELQHAILDYLAMMEHLLVEVTNERATKNALERNLMPALDQIDTTACDDSTIRSSLAIATSKMERNPSQNPKEVLYKELIKR